MNNFVTAFVIVIIDNQIVDLLRSHKYAMARDSDSDKLFKQIVHYA